MLNVGNPPRITKSLHVFVRHVLPFGWILRLCNIIIDNMNRWKCMVYLVRKHLQDRIPHCNYTYTTLLISTFSIVASSWLTIVLYRESRHEACETHFQGTTRVDISSSMASLNNYNI